MPWWGSACTCPSSKIDLNSVSMSVRAIVILSSVENDAACSSVCPECHAWTSIFWFENFGYGFGVMSVGICSCLWNSSCMVSSCV